MAHLVTCFYCKEKFDRDKIDFVKISERRYAHKICHEQKSQEQDSEIQNLVALEKYILKLFKWDYVLPRVQKQIKEFHNQNGYSYSGMLKSLKWFYEIKNNKLPPPGDPSNNISIIPFIYENALRYDYTLFLLNDINEQKLKDGFKASERVVEIKAPRAKRPTPKLFDI